MQNAAVQLHSIYTSDRILYSMYIVLFYLNT